MYHMFCLSHLPRFYHPSNIWWWVQIMRVHIKQFLQSSCYVLLLMPACVPQRSFWKSSSYGCMLQSTYILHISSGTFLLYSCDEDPSITKHYSVSSSIKAQATYSIQHL
jgi:hypothetical protein